ncbi:MAG: restriction endonuclease [Candidatus Zixiibacteriota bacterium]
MAIPDYQSIMLPLLELTSREIELSISEAIEKLAVILGLSERDLKELLPSGQNHKFANRVGWARTYLKKARLLESPQRGFIKITQRGNEVLASKPNKIDNVFLRQFPEFLEFQKKKKQSEESVIEANKELGNKTPEDLLEESYQELIDTLSSDLLDRIKSESPQFFERLVIDLLIKMGYGGSRKDAGKAVGRSGDGGIDGIIKEDKLGLDVIYIQAKRWEGVVGRPIVQSFAGSLDGVRAKRGILITTSRFTKDAIDYANNIDKSIVLVDGEMLAKLMIDHDLGVSTIAKYEVKKLDSDYFVED